MPTDQKIIFNYNFCDRAPECGGIEVCPTGAIYFDKKSHRPVWNKSKCIFCLKCTLPNACPVGCILYAKGKKSIQTIEKMVKEDKQKHTWLWQERYGVQPALFPPKAIILTDKNFATQIKKPGPKLIDIWQEETLDCRLHSPLFSDLIGKNKIAIYKLDANQYPDLAKKLKVTKTPSLFLLQDQKEIYRHQGHTSTKGKIKQIQTQIQNLLQS